MQDQKPLEPEIINTESLERIGISALTESHRVHQSLGLEGTEDVRKNEYGDIATKGDIEAEKSILDLLKRSEIPMTVFSEEHGKIDLSESPKFTATLDGIDGSGLYKREYGVGRYGTMFSIYRGTDPTYDDYLFGGIMEHATGKLFFAVKGKGAFVLEDGKKRPLHCSTNQELKQDETRIEADENFDEVLNETIIHDTFISKLEGFKRIRIDATAAHYVDLSDGECDLVLECTRKGNLELAVGYAILIEAGGIIIDMKGESLGDKKYLEFGQDRYVPFIAAANPVIADNLLLQLNK